MRLRKWSEDRAQGLVVGQETLLGWVPKAGDLDLSGLDIDPELVNEATSIKLDEWKGELESQREWFQSLGGTLPPALELQRQLLLQRITNGMKVRGQA